MSNTNAPVGASVGAAPTNASVNTPVGVSNETTQQSVAKAPASDELFEVKVSGKTVKMTKEEVLRHASLSSAAQSRFEEAAKIKKSVEKIINTAKSNPIQVLMDPALGLTKDQIRESFEQWYTSEFIDPETLSPEERKYKEMESKLREFEEEKKKALEAKQREEEEHLTIKQREHLQKQIVDAIDSSGLPKTKFIAQRIAFYMRQNLVNGWEAPMEMIVEQVKRERAELMSDLTENSDAEMLIKMLGDGVVKKLQQHAINQLKNKRAAKLSTPSQSSMTSSSSNNKDSLNTVSANRRKMMFGK